MSPKTPLQTFAKNPAAASAVKALAKFNVTTAEDLLFYFPSRYLDFSKFSKISEAKTGEIITVRGKLKSIGARFSFKSRRSIADAVVSDDTGTLKVTWFNQGYLAKTLKSGQELLLSGRIDQYKGLQMINPVYELYTDESIHTGRIVPVYRVTEGLYHRTIRALVKNCLPAAAGLIDPLPEDVKEQNSLPSLTRAVTDIHFPPSDESLTLANQRFAFEEAFIQQLAVARHKLLLKQSAAPIIPQNIEMIKDFLSRLPFELTSSQKKALWEIIQDMEKPRPMNRLLEGDVGSGKTLVALLSALETALAGHQVVVLAPTEILAKQHYDTFFSHTSRYEANLALLTKNFQTINGRAINKEKLVEAIAGNEAKIIIGTHALLQENIDLHSPGLVIIDEQHRFGVGQRSFLVKNAHLLSMSATPIPRTLALSIYGDLEVSTLTQMPKGRQNIATSVVPETKRSEAYSFIKKELAAGRQAFIVTPRVEETENDETRSVKAEFKSLQTGIFKTYKLALLHGKMKGAEKEKVMTEFYEKKTDILVSTSVIEIGIDVPNATVMVIEDAENFGLAQLHQLRGRVGRGKHKSYCLLFTKSQNPASLERLKLFSATRDGFKLAEIDLKQRGFGSLFGTEQTGFYFKYSRYLTSEILQSAKASAQKLAAQDPELAGYPLLKQKVDPLTEQIHLE